MMRKEFKSVLTLPRHSQDAFAPVRGHHHHPWAPLHLFQPLAVAIVPVQSSAAVPDHNVAIVHYFKRSGLVIQFELVQVPFEPDLVLIDSVVFCDREKCIAYWMKKALGNCGVGVEIDLLY